METVVDFLDDLLLSDLTIQIAEIVVPVLVAALMGYLVQALHSVSSYIKANATEAQIEVLKRLADIVVRAVEQYYKTNELGVRFTTTPDEDQVKAIRKAKLDRAIGEFEALRKLHNVGNVPGLDMRSYIENAVNQQRT